MSTDHQRFALAPYRQPGLAPPGEGSAWRQGDCAVVPMPGSDLPDRCVICNAPADGFRFVDASGIEIPLCHRHRSRPLLGPRLKRAGLVFVPLSGVALAPLVGFASLAAGLAVLGGFLLLGLLLIIVSAVIPRSPVRVIAAQENHIVLRVGFPFLASLPPREHLSNKDQQP